MTKGPEVKKMGRENSREGNLRDGGGGIPRPQVTNSPSKLAIRTNTKLLGKKPIKQIKQIHAFFYPPSLFPN